MPSDETKASIGGVNVPAWVLAMIATALCVGAIAYFVTRPERRVQRGLFNRMEWSEPMYEGDPAYLDSDNLKWRDSRWTPILPRGQAYCADGTCNGLLRPSRATQESFPVTTGTDLQSQCEAEAYQMAATQTRGHVGATIGDFEGCGWKSDPNAMPDTCLPPPGNWQVVGDAVARNESGSYRVRAWKKL